MELPGQAVNGQLGKPPLGDLERGPGQVGTAGQWQGARERWEESLSKSLQQAQSPDCISEGGRW